MGDLAEEVKARVPLRMVAGTAAARVNCMFHGSATPDLHLRHGDNTFKCYSTKCPAHEPGDVINWVMLRDGLSFQDALRQLADTYGVHADVDDARVEILTRATQYFQNRLYTRAGRKALEMLTNRGFSQVTLMSYNVGLCDMLPDNITLDEAKQVGLVRRSQYNMDYLHLMDHIVFPVHDRKGRVVHMQGRVYCEGHVARLAKYRALAKDVKVAGEKRSYPISDYLYNEAALHTSSREVFLFEGIPDCLTALQWNLPAVALFGNEYLDKQSAKFKKIRTLYVCMDSDSATRQVVLKQLATLQQKLPGLVVYDIILPTAKDLNEFALKGGTVDEFLAIAAESGRTLIERLLEKWGHQPSLHRPLLETVVAIPGHEAYYPRLAACMTTTEEAVRFAGTLLKRTSS